MSATDPHILPRSEWGANPLVTPAGTIVTPTEELWLHHTAGEQFDEAGMRMLQAFTLHRQDEHYVDLEYSFILDHVDCKIFESRGVGRNTAATFDHNSISHAICVMGNFQVDRPSDFLIHTLANLVAWGFEHGWWKHCAITGGHRDASGNSTACPGTFLEEDVAKINALALQIHAGSAPPVPPKVKPMYSPGLGGNQGGIAAVWEVDAVVAGVTRKVVLAAVADNGDVYAWGVPSRPWPTKATDFAGRHAASIGQAAGLPFGRYTITDTAGETYTP